MCESTCWSHRVLQGLEQQRADRGESAGRPGSLGAALVLPRAPCHTQRRDVEKDEREHGKDRSVCHQDTEKRPRCTEGTHDIPGGLPC